MDLANWENPMKRPTLHKSESAKIRVISVSQRRDCGAWGSDGGSMEPQSGKRTCTSVVPRSRLTLLGLLSTDYLVVNTFSLESPLRRGRKLTWGVDHQCQQGPAAAQPRSEQGLWAWLSRSLWQRTQASRGTGKLG